MQVWVSGGSQFHRLEQHSWVSVQQRWRLCVGQVSSLHTRCGHGTVTKLTWVTVFL